MFIQECCTFYTFVLQISKQESAAAPVAETSSSMSTESGGAVTEEELTDWVKMTCLLCRRAFPSKDILIKHQQKSDLHKVSVMYGTRGER